MQPYGDISRLAMLIVHYESTCDFGNPGAIAVLQWYEKFCATKGRNPTEPLDLSAKQLKSLPDLIKLSLSFGVPRVNLTNNPDLEDIGELQEMPLITKLWTIEHAIDIEKSPPIILALTEIRKALLGSKTIIKLSLQHIDRVPVYLQLLPSLEELELCHAYKINSLRNLKNFKFLRKLVLNNLYKLSNLKSLANLEALKILEIQYVGDINGFLEGVENVPTLEKIYLFRVGIDNLEPLQKLPHLYEINIWDCNRLQHVHSLHKFRKLKKFLLLRTDKLQTISINKTNDSLKELEIYGANRLHSITGINYLSNLKKIVICTDQNINNLDGIESSLSLEEIKVGVSDIGFLRHVLKNHIISGKYQLFKVIDWKTKISIDLLQENFSETSSITVQLLADQMVATAVGKELHSTEKSGPMAPTAMLNLIPPTPNGGAGMSDIPGLIIV